jgi:hypothetical protein
VYNSGATPPSYAASPVTFTADGTANVVVEFTASGATKTLSNVMFNYGNGTTWALATPTLQTELAACQRYYVRWSGTDNANAFSGMGNAYSSTQAGIMLRPPVQMRVNPTAVDYNGGELADGGGSSFAITAITINQSDSKSPLLFCTVASGLTQYRVYYTYSGNSTSAYIGLTAEL